VGVVLLRDRAEKRPQKSKKKHAGGRHDLHTKSDVISQSSQRKKGDSFLLYRPDYSESMAEGSKYSANPNAKASNPKSRNMNSEISQGTR